MSSNNVVKRNLTDDYELLQQVGIGSYGEVFKARAIRSGETVAIKMVKIGANGNFSLIQQEIVLLKDCSHSNIISYLGSYFHKDCLAIVMEYCNGGSLHDIYKMTGALNELQIAFICRETLKGLQYLNSKQQVHRDIKAANILLTKNGDVKLADFGIAVQISATIGKCKSFIGTPYWMAPEVASVDDNGGYGFSCDVWSIGITAIELAELAPPHYELSPMRVLHLLAKSSYKPPKLKDKKKWSHVFHDFVKVCLTKNPKKRPSPEKLLQSHHFVCGSLSPRFTKELLDRVNNPSSARSETKRLHDSVENALQQELGADLDVEHLNKELSGDTETESSSHSEQTPEPVRSYHNGLTLPAKQYISHSNNTLFDNVKKDEDDSEYLTPKQNFFDNLPPPMYAQRVHHPSSGSKRPSVDHNVEEILPRNVRVNLERSATLEGRSPAQGNTQANGFKSRLAQFDLQTSVFTRTANSCSYGLVSTPQITMGAGFCTVVHDCHLRINTSDVWTHPANNRKFLVIGAEEGIFIHDLTYLANENVMQQISDRRCSSIYIIDDCLMAVQGKTQYVYQHNILQLYHQQSIFQKYSKRLATLTEKYKKLLVRLPETKNLYKFTVERSVLNNSLYMAVAVPNEIILYSWFEPRKTFMQLKSVSASVPSTGLFHLIFDMGPLNADYPQVCVGVYDRQKSDVDLEQSEEIPKEADEVNLHFQLVDFNDHGKLEHFVAKSMNSDLFDTLRPHVENNSNLTYTDRNRRNVIALKQLDRDTFFIAFENQVVIVNSQGVLKQTNLMQTLFNVDFKITAAFPLSDSVLLFHDNGLRGLSFFNSSIVTQDLEDVMKLFTVIGTEKLIVLRSRSLLPRTIRPNNSFPAPNSRFPLISSIVSTSKNELKEENLTDGEDLLILIGHVEN